MTTSVDHKFRFYPGIDIAYRPATDWKLFLSYNKGFRLPSFTELYYKSPTHEGNKGLKPEENRSLQLGAQYSRKGISATARAFYHRGNRMIDWVMYNAEDTYHSAAFNLDNLGTQARLRMELPEMAGKDTWVRSIDLSYTYIHQERHDDTEIFKSNYAMEYLRHKLTANINHRIFSKLEATWSVRWQDRMGGYIVYGDTYTDPNTGYLRATSTGEFKEYSPYATLDLKIQWTDRHYDLYVKGTNITGHKYYDLGSIRQPGVWVMAGARYRL